MSKMMEIAVKMLSAAIARSTASDSRKEASEFELLVIKINMLEQCTERAHTRKDN